MGTGPYVAVVALSEAADTGEHTNLRGIGSANANIARRGRSGGIRGLTNGENEWERGSVARASPSDG